ncbi:MAG: T9SS type A sorting domain-containing protein, partial [Prevotellaceae bacterium]|nr:T9SS type A sorting domain-containing protein [Prevotellaceae bacterium]
ALSVYPNPVAAGGIVKLKQAELADGEDAPYTACYLFDAQGRLTLTGSFSALRGGLTMPETPGIYHLVLEGKAGRTVVKVAVGQQK